MTDTALVRNPNPRTVIEIGEQTYTVDEFIQAYWKQQSDIQMLSNELSDVTEALRSIHERVSAGAWDDTLSVSEAAWLLAEELDEQPTDEELRALANDAKASE